ncbi:hypothetical protein HMPREF0972_01506 [Actinomyces sp. oral taxon 848 str. F0332]|nr:hypothetical protein HMPREF0972_01506 [Actinomyces sp. oral taxon 848 str. F0332]
MRRVSRQKPKSHPREPHEVRRACPRGIRKSSKAAGQPQVTRP